MNEKEQNQGDAAVSAELTVSVENRAAFETHKQIVLALFLATALIAVGAGVALYGLDQLGKGPSCLMVVAISGILGGFVSSLKRMYSFKDIFPRKDYNSWLKGANFYVVCYATVPSLVGGIAAVILYVIFASGMLQGDVFPMFHCSGGVGKCDEFHAFVSNWQPKLATDYAKAIVWGFIAGFSERVVPNVVNRLGTGAMK